jgi:hypothetical protein
MVEGPVYTLYILESDLSNTLVSDLAYLPTGRQARRGLRGTFRSSFQRDGSQKALNSIFAKKRTGSSSPLQAPLEVGYQGSSLLIMKNF